MNNLGKETERTTSQPQITWLGPLSFRFAQLLAFRSRCCMNACNSSCTGAISMGTLSELSVHSEVRTVTPKSAMKVASEGEKDFARRGTNCWKCSSSKAFPRHLKALQNASSVFAKTDLKIWGTSHFCLPMTAAGSLLSLEDALGQCLHLPGRTQGPH